MPIQDAPHSPAVAWGVGRTALEIPPHGCFHSVLWVLQGHDPVTGALPLRQCHHYLFPYRTCLTGLESSLHGSDDTGNWGLGKGSLLEGGTLEGKRGWGYWFMAQEASPSCTRTEMIIGYHHLSRRGVLLLAWPLFLGTLE